MPRIQLFEFIDQPWYPETFRRMQADYLQFAARMGAGHENLIPLFKKALEASRADQIIDLCSGSGGPWAHLRSKLAEAGLPVQVKLTDKFPHPEVVSQWSSSADSLVEYLSEPVDAARVPAHLTGMRTMFEGFHHFKPADALNILQDAAGKGEAIGIFEASLQPPLGWLVLLLSPLMTLFGYIFVTPLIKPRKFSRFLFTYLIPLVPLATIWDGVISLLRVYSPAELNALTAQVKAEDYAWESGHASTGTPIFTFTYLIGYPVNNS